MAERDPNGWHLEKRVALSHIISTLAVATSVIWWGGKVEQRLALLEQSTVTQHERDERQDKASAEALAIIQTHLSKIDDKLDRLLEERRR